MHDQAGIGSLEDATKRAVEIERFDGVHYKHEAIEGPWDAVVVDAWKIEESKNALTDEEFIKALERECDELSKLKDELVEFREKLKVTGEEWTAVNALAQSLFTAFHIRRIAPGVNKKTKCTASEWPCAQDARFEVRTEGPPVAHGTVCAIHLGQTIMRFVPAPT